MVRKKKGKDRKIIPFPKKKRGTKAPGVATDSDLAFTSEESIEKFFSDLTTEDMIRLSKTDWANIQLTVDDVVKGPLVNYLTEDDMLFDEVTFLIHEIMFYAGSHRGNRSSLEVLKNKLVNFLNKLE